MLLNVSEEKFFKENPKPEQARKNKTKCSTTNNVFLSTALHKELGCIAITLASRAWNLLSAVYLSPYYTASLHLKKKMYYS